MVPILVLDHYLLTNQSGFLTTTIYGTFILAEKIS